VSARGRSREPDGRIATLREAAEAMAHGQFHPPLPAGGGAVTDDVDRLGEALSRLGAELERRLAEATAIVRLGEKVNSGLLLHEVLDQVFDSFQSIFPYDRIGCSMLEDGGRTVRAVWTRSVRGETRLGVGYSAPLAGSSLAQIIETGRPRIINDLAQYLHAHPLSESTRIALADGVRSSLTCPLVAQGKRVGFVFFSSFTPNTYSEHHVELLMQIAGQLSLVVEKGRMYAELLQTKSELEAANRTLSQAARIDGLTGVPNRRTMDEMLENAWRRAVRQRTPLSLILIDIDHFKEFNDRFGHVEGDRCLIRVANEMRSALRRPDDFLARYGGEEFLAFPASATVDVAAQLADQLRARVERIPMTVSDSAEPTRVTISAGVAGVAGADAASIGSVTDLIESADRALYSAKAAGRNRVARASPEPSGRAGYP
jgi:diguanylate cyclase (GGDEF)-like protein